MPYVCYSTPDVHMDNQCLFSDDYEYFRIRLCSITHYNAASTEISFLFCAHTKYNMKTSDKITIDGKIYRQGENYI